MIDEEEINKSNQGLILNGNFDSSLNLRSKNTIQLNMSKAHHFQERDYMFYEVMRLLAKVLEFVHDAEVWVTLEEYFILFYHNGGSSQLLKKEVIGALE